MAAPSRPEPSIWRTSPVTVAIVASTVLVYLVQVYQHHVTGDMSDIASVLAISRAGLDQGRYWQLVTYAWTHSEGLPLHIIVNMLMVWVLGSVAEQLFGHVRYLLLYLGGCVFSVIPFLVFDSSQDTVLMGASGAAFALLAAMAVLCPRVRVRLLLFFIIPMNMRMMNLALLACGLELFFLVFNILPGISHGAHLAGAVFGAIFAFAFRPTDSILIEAADN